MTRDTKSSPANNASEAQTTPRKQIPPRRTPRRRLSAEERKAQILRAVIDVVARDGFDDASTSRIAAQANVSKGLIWRYFADKTELMKEAVTAAITVMIGEIAGDLNQSLPVPELIRTMIRRTTILRTTTHRNEFQAVDRITRNLRNQDGTPAFSPHDYEPVYSGQESLFRRGQNEGVFRPFDTRVMAVAYQGAIDATLSYLDAHPEVDAAASADALAELLIAAMLK